MHFYHVQRLDITITYAFFSAVRTEALPNREHRQIATEQPGPKVDRYISVKGMSSCPQLIPNLVAHQDRQEFLPKDLPERFYVTGLPEVMFETRNLLC